MDNPKNPSENPEIIVSPEDRRQQLISAERRLQVGRREVQSDKNEQQNTQRKKQLIMGFSLATAVVVIAIVLIVILGSNVPIK